MGNSPSTPAPRPAPAPAPPRAPRTPKRSILDHPALLAPAPPAAPPTTPAAPIPIPSHSRHPPPPPPGPPADLASGLDLLHHTEHSTHRHIQYNSTRSFGAVRRGAPLAPGPGPGPGPAPAPAPRAPFVPEVVRTSLPLRLPQPPSPARRARAKRPAGDAPERPSADRDSDEARLFPTTVVWRGPAKEVFLAGSFDPLEWRARERMRYDPTAGTHSLTLLLAPGTYRLKFIVDDAWRSSEAMPTAVDDETGNLVNYIDVEDPAAPEPPTTDEERHGWDARVMKANRRRTYPARHHPARHPPQLPPAGDSEFWGDADTDTELEQLPGWERGRDGVVEKWTNTIPPPLVAAATHEEAYVLAVQAQRDVRRGGAGTRGALAALAPGGVPNIPPAPRLPRHLDKVLLNARSSAAASSSSSSSGKRKGSRARLGMTNLLAPPDPRSHSATAAEQWAQADDSSVLPVPNHVVLHHLGTSAIKNGVLAISDTTRYNKKYITTIYYKPA